MDSAAPRADGDQQVCVRCRSLAAIVHFVVTDMEDTEQVYHFCELCGRQFASMVQPHQVRGYCAEARPHDATTTIDRSFVVLGQGNVKELCRAATILDGGLRGPREWDVPPNLVPELQRHPGGVFSIEGTPLELEIFESWFQ